ncbi:T9SS type A sorting domain-containing protein [Flavobacterium sp.]|uniref:T9SS type A sorting domain-containing protein n=1 Tax=Flavobacterium sp. TaxID=239 RepID=UPI0026136010|nr:T9SS type A sorting domain-containing protein [Flavobacterium sp.]
MIKKILVLTLLLPLFSFAQQLQLPKFTYQVNEEIILYYKKFPEAGTDWIVFGRKDTGEELRTSELLTGNGTWSNSIGEPGTYYFGVQKLRDGSRNLDEIYDFVVVADSSAEESIIFQRNVDPDDISTGFKASITKSDHDSVFTDSFQTSESFDLSSITFYGFQVQDFSFNSGLGVSIYKDKDGSPSGKPTVEGEDVVMDLLLHEDSKAIYQHLTLISDEPDNRKELNDYTVDVKRALELDGAPAVTLEKNVRYWVSFAPLFSDGLLAEWFWRSLKTEAGPYAKRFDFGLDDWVALKAVNFAFTVRGVKSKKLKNEDFVLSQIREIKILPNPSEGLFTVLSDQNIRSLKGYDVMGRLITRSETNQVDLTSNEKGMYLLIVEDDEGMQTTKKIIKK